MSVEKEIVEYIKSDLEGLEKKVDDGFRDSGKKIDDGLRDLNTKIDVFMANCVTKTDFKEYKDGIRERIEKTESGKLDKDDFEPIKTTMNRVNWIVITAVVAGLLTLLFK